MNLTGWDSNNVAGSLEAAQYVQQLGHDVHAIALNTSAMKNSIWANNMVGIIHMVNAKKELESNIARQNYMALFDRVANSFDSLLIVVQEESAMVSEIGELIDVFIEFLDETDTTIILPIEIPNFDRTQDYEKLDFINADALIDGYNYFLKERVRRDELWKQAVDTFAKCPEGNLQLLNAVGDMATDVLNITHLYRKALESLKARILTYNSYLKIGIDVVEAYERQFDLRGQCITLYKSLPEGTQVPFDIQEFVDSAKTIDENLNKFFEVAGCATVNSRFMADAEYNEILTWYRNVEKVAMSNVKFLEKWDEKVKTFQSILIALLGRG
jgi:hypothetical protein